jgi:hypothetical protein
MRIIGIRQQCIADHSRVKARVGRNSAAYSAECNMIIHER